MWRYISKIFSNKLIISKICIFKLFCPKNCWGNKKILVSTSHFRYFVHVVLKIKSLQLRFWRWRSNFCPKKQKLSAQHSHFLFFKIKNKLSGGFRQKFDQKPMSIFQICILTQENWPLIPMAVDAEVIGKPKTYHTNYGWKLQLSV